MDHVRRTRQQIYDDADAPPNMEALGVEVITGTAGFMDQFVARQLDSPLLAILERILRYRGQRKGSGALSGRDS